MEIQFTIKLVGSTQSGAQVLKKPSDVIQQGTLGASISESVTEKGVAPDKGGGQGDDPGPGGGGGGAGTVIVIGPIVIGGSLSSQDAGKGGGQGDDPGPGGHD